MKNKATKKCNHPKFIKLPNKKKYSNGYNRSIFIHEYQCKICKEKFRNTDSCPIYADGYHKIVTLKGMFYEQCGDVEEIVEKHSRNKKELIRTLCVDKINYARECLAQLACGIKSISNNERYKKFQNELQKLTDEIKNKHIFEKL